MTLSIKGLFATLSITTLYRVSHFIYCYAEYHYTECRNNVFRYDECRYNVCRYAECRGAR